MPIWRPVLMGDHDWRMFALMALAAIINLVSDLALIVGIVLVVESIRNHPWHILDAILWPAGPFLLVGWWGPFRGLILSLMDAWYDSEV